MTKRFLVIWLVGAVIVGLLGYAIQVRFQQNLGFARQNFVEMGHQDTMRGVQTISTNFKSIYENMRTLAALPSVRSIDRHASTFDAEARITFQQIYNNLAANVSVSEVYIVPIDMNPDRIDPITLKNEEPIATFDHLILNAGNGMSAADRKSNPAEVAQKSTPGPAQIETYEYHQMVEHADWFKAHYPTTDKISEFETPFISGAEVITCDNTTYVQTLNDHDRSGIIFSVPFFGPGGEIRGMISTVVLSNALREMLPAPQLALINTNNSLVIAGSNVSKIDDSLSYIQQGRAHPKLIYSEVAPLPVVDNRNPWQVWSGLPNQTYLESTGVKGAYYNRRQEALTLLGISLIACICLYLMQQNVSQARRLNQSLSQERDLAERSEQEARVSAQAFQKLNDDISRLNADLAVKIKLLTEAQEDIVRKGKMAQLGNLVATVAHELRNPLGGVRTTAFMLRRKLKDSPIDVLPQLERIEIGIGRCDSIISQLLDFSRAQPLITSNLDLNVWLEELLAEEVAKLPPTLLVTCSLPDHKLEAQIDPERLRRGVINLLANAADALLTKSATIIPARNGGPEIKIELAQTQRGFEISVIDNGPGIASDVISKISEPLFTTKSFGTGLGLAAVRKVAELHGGGLEINSVPGHGAKFTIWIAASAATAAA